MSAARPSGRRALSTALCTVLLAWSNQTLAKPERMLGEVILHTFSFRPAGWLPLRGQTLNKSAYPGLASAVGNTWGGSDTTFTLPDLTGRSLIEAGPGKPFGVPVGSAWATLPALGGLVGHDHATQAQGVLTSARITGGADVPNVTTAALTSSGAGNPIEVRPPSIGVRFSVATEGTLRRRSCIVGEVVPYIGQLEPDPNVFLPADGRELDISAHQYLYMLLGTAFGGNGMTTFALPNLQGRFPVHPNIGNPNGLTVSFAQKTEPASVRVEPQHLPGGSLGHAADAQGLPYLSSPRVGTPTVNTLVGSTEVRHPDVTLDLLPPALPVRHYVCINGLFPLDPDADHASTGFMGELRLMAFQAMNGSWMIPTGWMASEGQTLQINQYLSLYTLIGTLYGNAAGPAFALPDLRGRLPVDGGTLAGSAVPHGQYAGTPALTFAPEHLPAGENLGTSLTASTVNAPGAIPSPRGGMAQTAAASSLSRLPPGPATPLGFSLPVIGLPYLINNGGEYPPSE